MNQSLRTPVAVVVATVVALLVLPAPTGARQPSPPEGARAQVAVRVDDDRLISIEGRGYLADSVVQVEIRTAPDVVTAAPLATIGLRASSRAAPGEVSEVPVSSSGTFEVARLLDCDADVDRLMVAVTGTDAVGRPAVVTRHLDVPACSSGASSSIGGDGDDAPTGGDARPTPGLDPAGSNAVSPRIVWLLVVVLAAAVAVLAVRRGRAER